MENFEGSKKQILNFPLIFEVYYPRVPGAKTVLPTGGG